MTQEMAALLAALSDDNADSETLTNAINALLETI